MGVVVARASSPEVFGSFALFLSFATLAVGLQRVIVSEPLLRGADEFTTEGTLGGAVRRSLAGSLVIGTTFSVAGVVGVLVAGVPLMPSLLSVVVVGAFVQDFARFASLALGRPRSMLIADLVSAIGQLGLLAWVGASNGEFGWYIVAWGVGAMLGPMIVFVPILRAVTRNAQPIHGFARARWRAQGAQFGADYTLGIISSQSTLVTLSLVDGPLGVAALRGADTLAGPIRVLLQSMPARYLGLWASEHRNGQSILRSVFRVIAIASIPVVVWVTALVLLPDSIGTQLLGASWALAEPVLPIIAFALLPVTVTSICGVGLKSLDGGAMLLAARCWVTPVSVAAGVLGAILGGAVGAAIGSLAVSIGAAVLWVVMLVLKDRMRNG